MQTLRSNSYSKDSQAKCRKKKYFTKMMDSRVTTVCDWLLCNNFLWLAPVWQLFVIGSRVTPVCDWLPCDNCLWLAPVWQQFVIGSTVTTVCVIGFIVTTICDWFPCDNCLWLPLVWQLFVIGSRVTTVCDWFPLFALKSSDLLGLVTTDLQGLFIWPNISRDKYFSSYILFLCS